MSHSEQNLVIKCKGVWSPDTTGNFENLLAEVKELLSEVMCLEEVEIITDTEAQTA